MQTPPNKLQIGGGSEEGIAVFSLAPPPTPAVEKRRVWRRRRMGGGVEIGRSVAKVTIGKEIASFKPDYHNKHLQRWPPLRTMTLPVVVQSILMITIWLGMRMLTGEVKKWLVEVLTELVERHRRVRAAVTDEMVKFATSLSRESVVDIKGVVSVPAQSITGATQQAGEQLVRVNQYTHLNFRYLDLHTVANQGIFSIKGQVKNIFREFLLSEGFLEMETPTLIAGSRKGLDVEMDIMEHFSEYLLKILRLTFKEGVQMRKEAGVEIDPLGDLNTESERKLGQLVLQKCNTEFYILHPYPLAVRPFYTMPCYDDPKYSNSFDVFIRGSQRIHVLEDLAQRAQECGIDVKTISTYIDSVRYGRIWSGFGARWHSTISENAHFSLVIHRD
ncbi:hypothetical protein BUALT_Bualt05G0026500 [Buddleja alternifolia]|uniref:Aminoacyl-tRNA synthetase class II (D/K/N) domain-containing protein n=1 Tax=Buddleja alternifolia TaxID=168488 RepID=A0AAV6XFV9_9LAMI|nr:hypothetical protein BUALT_Bualt05G0026500 [Buddleja alternifolia]